MSKLNGRELSYARAHGTIKVPNAPQIGPELSSTSNGSNRAVTMLVEDDCVIIGVPVAGRPNELVYVPLTNFSHFTVKTQA